MAVRTGDVAPEFDLEVGYRERVTLSDFRSRANVLLVFHPFAFTPVCEDEARDLQENLQSFRDAGTEIVFVSCDPSAARQAWKQRARRRVHLRLRLLAARRGGEGVRRLQRGERRAASRHVPDRPRGTVIWSLVNERDEQRTEMVPDSLEVLAASE